MRSCGWIYVWQHVVLNVSIVTLSELILRMFSWTLRGKNCSGAIWPQKSTGEDLHQIVLNVTLLLPTSLSHSALIFSCFIV